VGWGEVNTWKELEGTGNDIIFLITNFIKNGNKS
jgi:hypothetical protein